MDGIERSASIDGFTRVYVRVTYPLGYSVTRSSRTMHFAYTKRRFTKTSATNKT